ncbi:MAG: hypothetical protein J6O55_09340 [Lachnospiraceae bacterium]|nr:hypothetical protein [Lachnospiraceae bacterium]
MKKYISIILLATLSTGLIACGGAAANGTATNGTVANGQAANEPGTPEEAATEEKNADNQEDLQPEKDFGPEDIPDADTGNDMAEGGDSKDGESANEAGSGGEDMNTEGPAIDGTGTASLKQSVNSFNWKLFETLDEKGNHFYSPYGLVSALALADLAAKGDTKAELEELLSVSDLQAFESASEAYTDRKWEDSAKLKNASSIWLDKSLKQSGGAKENFSDPAVKYFKGDFHSVDFRNNAEGAKQDISEWVNKATEGFIPDYAPGVNSDTVADLLNAVYFYGEWDYPFKGEDTFKETFHGLKGDSEIDMMHNDHIDLRYIKDYKGISAIAYPYKDRNIEMDFLIPAEGQGKGIKELLLEAGKDEFFDALDSAEEMNITDLRLPKFNLDITWEGLSGTLKELGLKTAFSDNADFSNLAEELKISDILHRAKLEVDEEGSRAAAVTEIMMELTGAMSVEEPIEFAVDRPFVLAIRDRESGIILFMGMVNDLDG